MTRKATTRSKSAKAAATDAPQTDLPEAGPAPAPAANDDTGLVTQPLIVIAAAAVPDGLAARLPGLALRAVDPAATDAASDPVLRAALAPALALLAPAGAEAAARAMAEAAGRPELPVLALDEAATALPAALAAQLEAARKDAGAARRTSALLRHESEDVNRRMHAMERFLYSLGGPRVSHAIHWPPADHMARIGEGGATVSQRLPIDSPGITAVDLWLPDADEAAARALDVAIEASDGTRHPLPLDEIALGRDDGWLRFAAPEPLGGERQDCRLTVAGAPEGLGIGLGPAVPDEAFAAEGIDARAHVLALRVWRAVTGAAVNAAGAGLQPGAAGVPAGGGRPEGLTASRLLPSDLTRPSLLASPRSATDHVSTAFWAQEDAILVHPSARGPVCAILQRVHLPRLWRLSAVVHAARRDGPPLAFAMGVAPAGTITESDWDEHLGPWTALPPGGWGEVHSALDRQPLSARLCDVILASAVSGGGPNDNAWALFRAFRAIWMRGE